MPQLLDPLYEVSRAYRLMMDLLERDPYVDLDRLHLVATDPERPSPEAWLSGVGVEYASQIHRDAVGGIHGDEHAALAYLRVCEPKIAELQPAA